MTTAYRAADRDAEVERLRERVRELEAMVSLYSFVPFDSACPYCGSNRRCVAKTIPSVDGDAKNAVHVMRTFVAAGRVGTWWRRRTRPAHFVVKCALCLGEFCEAMKGATSGGGDE